MSRELPERIVLLDWVYFKDAVASPRPEDARVRFAEGAARRLKDELTDEERAFIVELVMLYREGQDILAAGDASAIRYALAVLRETRLARRTAPKENPAP